MDRLMLNSPIGQVWGVGDNYVKRLKKLEIETVEDLIYHKPSRYEDWSLISPIGKVQAGEKVTVVGKLMSIQPIKTRNGKQMQIAKIMDQDSEMQVVWFNQRYLITAMRVGGWYSFSGKADRFNGLLSMLSPEWEKVDGGQVRNGDDLGSIHTGRLVPIYPETYGVSSKWLRSRIKVCLDMVLPIQDWLQVAKAKLSGKLSFGMVDLTTALFQLHFPDSMEMAEKANLRLAHDELLMLHLENLIRRSEWKRNKVGTKFNINNSVINKFVSSLPFKLTGAQDRVIKEICQDLGREQPMNRLLEGDVGSGKTVVAAAAMYLAVASGCQAALMAPTEILAEQHFETLRDLLGNSDLPRPLTKKEGGIRVVLQTGRKKFVKKGKDDAFDVIVGTHALLTDVVNFDNLGLAVIDEQHRFGVEQRAKLVNKDSAPHVLSMTATPIPRTVALTLYGDLSLSVLDEMPPGRKPVKTWLVPNFKRKNAYEWIREQINGGTEGRRNERTKELKEGRKATQVRENSKSQAFIVCPFIEVSESMSTVKAAKEEFEGLKKIFSDLNLDLLHGKLKGKDKDEVIDKFRTGETDILVSTPVVEVGVDIPKASIMLIEAAERFGLAQLHQLRGRVGRAGQQAYCLLFTESDSPQTKKRLKAMENISSGMQLAELDMKMRGPGQIYGTSQHGFVDLRFADYSDRKLIQDTKLFAQKVFPELGDFPDLRKKLENRKMSQVINN